MSGRSSPVRRSRPASAHGAHAAAAAAPSPSSPILSRKHSDTLTVLLTRPLSASDVGTWRAAGRRDERAPGELIVAQLPRQVQFEAPPPSAAMTRPGLALLAARQRHVRFGSRPSTAAAIDRLVDRYAAANAVTEADVTKLSPARCTHVRDCPKAVATAEKGAEKEQDAARPAILDFQLYSAVTITFEMRGASGAW